MSYSRAGSERFTLIDNLPDLDDLEESNNYSGKRLNSNPQAEQPSNMSKFIRNSHNRPKNMMEEYMEPPSQPMHSSMQPPMNSPMQPPMNSPMQTPMNSPMQTPMQKLNSFGAPTCLEIADHISQCPICSKFYNNDKTLWIISIVILIIICLFLLKKVLDQQHV